MIGNRLEMLSVAFHSMPLALMFPERTTQFAKHLEMFHQSYDQYAQHFYKRMDSLFYRLGQRRTLLHSEVIRLTARLHLIW